MDYIDSLFLFIRIYFNRLESTHALVPALDHTQEAFLAHVTLGLLLVIITSKE